MFGKKTKDWIICQKGLLGAPLCLELSEVHGTLRDNLQYELQSGKSTHLARVLGTKFKVRSLQNFHVGGLTSLLNYTDEHFFSGSWIES